jgi:VanZ family protein
MLSRTIPEHIVFRIVAVSALAGVLVVSFLPLDSVDPFRLNFGNSVDIGYMLAYALLACAAILSVPRQELTLWRGVGVVVTISLLGLAIELLQPLVGRTTSVVDFTENEVGIATGIAILYGYLIVERVWTRGNNKRTGGG